MWWQGTRKTLHHHNDHNNDNHRYNSQHDNATAAGVLDPEQHQPRRAQPLHADTPGARPHRVDAQAPRE
jgi:hypothetical protein